MADTMRELLQVLRLSLLRQNLSDEGGTNLLTGFLLENMKIATTPVDSLERGANPLRDMLNKKKSQMQVKNLQDHWLKVEQKIRSMEISNRLDEEFFNNIPRDFWAASAVASAALTSDYDVESEYVQGSDKYIETSKEIPYSEKKKGKKPKPAKGGSPPPARQIHQCPDNRSCIAKLLASNCWLSYICWTLCCPKPRCPAYSTCPCGPQGPCANVKMKPCPASMAATKKSMSCGTGPPPCSPCSAVCGKLFGRGHEHTECCCRCKDNPPLCGPPPPPPKKSSGRKSGSADDEYKDAAGKGSKESHEYGSDRYLDQPAEVKPVLVYSKKSYYDMMRPPNGRRIRLKKRLHPQTVKREREREFRRLPYTVQSSRSIHMVHPKKQQPANRYQENPLSHKFLKTLSTAQGPVRVEQKIEVKGTKESFVIVSHGEACECNLCNTLKSQKRMFGRFNRLKDSERGSRSGGEIQMNHMDNCGCSLCSILTSDFVRKKLTPSTIYDTPIIARSSNSMVNTDDLEKLSYDSSMWSNENSSDPNYDSISHKMNSLIRGSARPRHLMSVRRRVGHKRKACYCSQCSQKRSIRKLKRKFNEQLGLAEFFQLLQGSQQSGARSSTMDDLHSVARNDNTSNLSNWKPEKDVSSMIKASSTFNDDSKTHPSTEVTTQEETSRFSNWAYGTDPIFIAQDDSPEEARPKIMHWLQSSPDFVKSLESKLSYFIPDPEEFPNRIH